MLGTNLNVFFRVQYAFNDFAVRQAALALQKSPLDVEKYGIRAMNFENLWDKTVTSGNFTGFMQQRYAVSLFCGEVVATVRLITRL